MKGERIRRLRAEIASELDGVGDALRPEELEAVLRWLSTAPRAQPTEEMTERLLENLRPHLPARRFRLRMEEAGAGHGPGGLALLRALLPQATLLGRAFWLGSAVVAAVLVLVLLIMDAAPALVLAAPVLAVAGVALAFRGARRSGLWEAELACPVDPITLALARFLLVVGYDTALLGLATVVLGVAGTGSGLQAGAGAFLLAWLAPFLFLGTVAFVISSRWGGPAGLTAGLGVWAVFLWVHLRRPPVGLDFLALPGTEAWWTGKVILLAATGLALLSLRARRAWRHHLEV